MKLYKEVIPSDQKVQMLELLTLPLNDNIESQSILLLRQEYLYKSKLLNQKDLLYQSKLRKLKKEYFTRMDQVLDRTVMGSSQLLEDNVVSLIKNIFLQYDGKLFDLIAYTILPNHLHVLYVAKDHAEDIVKKLTSEIALQAKLNLKDEIRFWDEPDHEQFLIEEDELVDLSSYIIGNPVKAGLVDYWKDWPHTYIDPEYV